MAHLYLSEHETAGVAEGRPGLFSALDRALKGQGWQVVLRPEAARDEGPRDPGYHLVHNAAVLWPRTLVARKAYLSAFWRIERTNDRWNWQVAGLPFEEGVVNRRFAADFMARWRERLLPQARLSREGFILMPLQGKLAERRHFQAMSPLAMIEATLEADPRPVAATLHPRETYSDADRAALNRLTERFPRFQLSSRPTAELLPACDLIVTQNSGVAVTGFFAEKPAVLFARIDFHHIAGSVPRDGLTDAFAQARRPAPFAEYLCWFFRHQAIPVKAEEAGRVILKRLAEHGWPVRPEN